MGEETPKKNPFFSIQSGIEDGLGRLFQKVNQLFKKEAPVDTKLIGRIFELQSLVEKILFDLLSFRNEYEKNGDPYLFSFVGSILEPLIKELTRIHQVIERQENATQQVKMLHRCMELVEKAKAWINLGIDYSKEKVHQTILSHTIQEFRTSIDRDIQVIQDYLDHSLEGIEGHDSFKSLLKTHIEPELTPHIVKLKELKEKCPNETSLEFMTKWRAEVDQSREKYFSICLHAVDTIINKAIPREDSKEEPFHEAEILSHLMTLEFEVDKLKNLIEEQNSFDDKKLRAYWTTLNKLEEEAHELNSNLRLSSEQAERVQTLLETLSQFRDI